MTNTLTGKVAFVTGPARGIGEAVARALAARGARLSLVGMEPERLASLAAELGGGHAWFECDVTDQAALERAVSGTGAALGGIDVVVANAGIGSFGTVSVTPLEAQVRVIEVNLIGVLRTVAATLPPVTARRGYYLLVSSAAALAPGPGLAAYAASRAGSSSSATRCAWSWPAKAWASASRILVGSTPTSCATPGRISAPSTRSCGACPDPWAS